jgi:WhiB family redox-sensing transcriptional regulator
MTATQQDRHPTHGLDAAARRLLLGELPDEWMLRAACRGHPRPDIFSPPPARADTKIKRSKAERRRRIVIAEAKTVCRRCPVTEACLDYANAAGERYGIWGGKTPRERGFKRDER